ncbi:uncharacterized protein EV420DRAFT_1259323 [Desarmillaria tabescens]|uniref:PARP catalytic domain-containing protein n=1 Tax=Armillaria tabescens TaxID=1929756 RepID=A0AA39NL99_ARMTA|nr:uncharacterized protein EV420DRAFT_1259323 [Desarmillaria tabescens]KAK0467737.1 hypothetical protein EV420DRAFT_1259323 [Desarmillaria tabescens]
MPKCKDYQFFPDRCTNLAAKKAPQLMRVPKGHVFYENVKKMFAKQWNDQRQNLPTVAKIYLITWTAYQRSSFEKYREEVARKRNIPDDKPKEVKCFRSEKRACSLGDKRSDTKLCWMSNCRLCPAIRTAFKSSLEYKRRMVMNNATIGVRFGGGLYMSPSSNKAIQYAVNLSEGSEYLTVLVTRTVLGKMQFLKDEQHHRLSPDKGYDSVKARAEGGPLEYVTYRKDAVRPAYLLMINERM